MSKGSILISGGAGFIGSHLADELLAHGYRVRALDSLAPQVHGETRSRPSYLSQDVELVVGDVRDPSAVDRALRGIDAVFHFAAAVGVGQSMYDIAHYTSVNNGGTAVLAEKLVKRNVGRLVVASSKSVYREGLYRDAGGLEPGGRPRSIEQLKRGEWELRDDAGELLSPVPTSEGKEVSLESIYALSKFDQERMCLLVGRAYGIPTVALRVFNVYGTRQALSNPYTGVLAIFASRLLNDHRPLVFEDGRQHRDFVSVKDVARAGRRALEREQADGHVINIGSGAAYSIEEIARRMAEITGKPALLPEITGTYRMGDIRHCFADITLARRLLGYTPKVALEEGLAELAEWLDGQVARDHAVEARAELEARGLTL